MQNHTNPGGYNLIVAAMSTPEVPCPLPFSFTFGENELKEYIQDNIQFTIDYVAKYMSKIHVYRPEGTYLMWLDCSKLPLSPKERDEWIINEAKLWLDTGSMFGVDGEDFERINVACPRKTLEEGLEAWRRAYEARGF